MARVRELGLGSVAFPALGTGIGGFPLDEAARITVAAVREELESPGSIEHVIFALRGAAAYEAFARALAAGDPAPTRSLLSPVPSAPAGSGSQSSVAAPGSPARRTENPA